MSSGYLSENTKKSHHSSILESPFKPVDIASIVFFRIAFGLLMLWEAYRFYSNGWIKEYFIDPEFYFTYYGFDWIHPLSGNGMYVLFSILGVLALFIATGFLYRLSASLFFIGFTYMFLIDQANYMNHLYLACLISFLMIFIPANRGFSIDALIRPAIKSDTVPAWGLWILRFQIGIVYFYGGIAKLNSDWLLHCEPMGLFLWANTDFPVIGKLFAQSWVVYIFCYGGLLLDLFVVPLLLWRRTRVFAYIAVLLFHLLNSELFTIGIFPWFMMAATLIFFSPAWPRNILKRFIQIKEVEQPRQRGFIMFDRGQKIAVLLILIYIAVQIVVPFRHFLYPGDVKWTEEGHHFSWQMMLRFKKGRTAFIATDPGTGESWMVNYGGYINPRQRARLAKWPYLIHQFSQFLSDEYRKKGLEDIEIRARSIVSLNGRKPQFLIDPDVDLVGEDYNLLPSRWIKPLKGPPPPKNENVFYKYKIRRIK